MYEVSNNELDQVVAGNPAIIVIGVASGYVALIDAAMDFGAGLGSGLYDATH
jgi:hypothetical protein